MAYIESGDLIVVKDKEICVCELPFYSKVRYIEIDSIDNWSIRVSLPLDIKSTGIQNVELVKTIALQDQTVHTGDYIKRQDKFSKIIKFQLLAKRLNPLSNLYTYAPVTIDEYGAETLHSYSGIEYIRAKNIKKEIEKYRKEKQKELDTYYSRLIQGFDLDNSVKGVPTEERLLL